MNELVKIQEKNGNQLVNARDLWEALDIKKDFTDWIKHQIDSLGLIENEDFSPFWGTSGSNRLMRDYSLILETAKHISMASRSEKGKEVRTYFIACEKKAYAVTVPKSLPEALRLAADLADANQRLLEENNEMQPKADFYDTVAEVDETIKMDIVAKVLGLPYGNITLFKKLREKKVLMDNNIPYQHYADMKWFKVKMRDNFDKYGNPHVTYTTTVTPKGIDGIRKLVAA